MKRRFVVCLVALALCAPVALAQDSDSGPITWLAFSKVKPGKTRDAVELTDLAAEMMQKLMDGGKVISWGLATPINHHPGGEWNHVEWVTLPNWAAVGDWATAVMTDMQSLGADEMARRDALFKEIYVEGSHSDQIVRHFLISPQEEDAPGMAYIYLAHFDAKPGQGEALTALFKELLPGMNDPHKASKDFTAYGAYTHEMHGTPGAMSHTAWFGMSGLGAIDKLGETVGAGDMARTQMLTDGHYDQILMVLHHVEAGD